MRSVTSPLKNLFEEKSSRNRIRVKYCIAKLCDCKVVNTTQPHPKHSTAMRGI